MKKINLVCTNFFILLFIAVIPKVSLATSVKLVSCGDKIFIKEAPNAFPLNFDRFDILLNEEKNKAYIRFFEKDTPQGEEVIPDAVIKGDQVSFLLPSNISGVGEASAVVIKGVKTKLYFDGNLFTCR